METRTKINFFWSGDDWTYLHDLTIKSHISVGHLPVIWLHGPKPKSRWWDGNGVDIRDADKIINITKFMKKGGNFKTASSLWRFMFLYKYGGWYSDTDAIAIYPWDTKKEWVLCRGTDGIIPTGVMKVPADEEMFLDMMDNLKTEWGNVHVFNNSFNKYKQYHKYSVKGYRFFPFGWKEWDELLKPASKTKYAMRGLSVHLYHTMFERAGMIDTIDQWIVNNPDTLLGVINKKVKG